MSYQLATRSHQGTTLEKGKNLLRYDNAILKKVFKDDLNSGQCCHLLAFARVLLNHCECGFSYSKLVRISS